MGCCRVLWNNWCYRGCVNGVLWRVLCRNRFSNTGLPGPRPKEEHRIEITSDDHDEISDRVKKWIESVEKTKGRSSPPTPSSSSSSWPSIPKVPHVLWGTKDFKKFYEPSLISIGPYHHGKPHLHSVEKIKPLCAKQFLTDSGQSIEHVYKKILSQVEEVKKCYDISSTNEYGDEKLAWMMLLDGCFILQFILSGCKIQVLRAHQNNYVRMDLFLLENQLPFRVLRLIFQGADKNMSMEDKIKTFVTDHGIVRLASTSKMQLKENEPAHLLNLLRTALLGGDQKKIVSEKQASSSPGGNKLQSFRSIRELKAAGSETCLLTDISFESHFFYGHLNLPELFIDDFTEPMFLNLVAYEMCPDAPDDYAITSFLAFLGDLIDHPDDVKELRANKILYNRLGSDEEVAQIFNEITAGLLYFDVYKHVKDGIQEHYDKKVNTWIAQALHDHFSSPWTITAFIAAVLIILLTGVQTYFAIHGN